MESELGAGQEWREVRLRYLPRSLNGGAHEGEELLGAWGVGFYQASFASGNFEEVELDLNLGRRDCVLTAGFENVADAVAGTFHVEALNNVPGFLQARSGACEFGSG